MTYKPQGHSSVSPYLVVDGAARTIEFLKRVFDATEVMVIAAPGGAVHHGEVRIDDSVVMLADGGGTRRAAGMTDGPRLIVRYARDGGLLTISIRCPLGSFT